MAKNSNEGSGSSGVKIVLIVLGSIGVCLLVCCGGGYWAFQKFVGQSLTMDPDQIRTMTSAISPIEMPDGYEPRMGMDLSGIGLPMKMVAYGRGQNERSIIMLMQAAAGGQGMTRQDFENAMAQQGQGQNIQVDSREIRVFDYAGEEHSFEFASGTARQSDAAMRQVSGMFPAEAGSAFLMMVDTEENWNEEAVMQMIASTGGTYVRTEEEETELPQEPGDAEATPAEPNAESDAEPATEEATPGDAATPTEEAAANETN